jgi:hypothetical protein
MQEFTIHPLVVGANETDQGVMTYLRDYGKRIWIPIYLFAFARIPCSAPSAKRLWRVGDLLRGAS